MSITMNIRGRFTQNVLLVSIIGGLCIYYVYQYMKIEGLMEDIDKEYENALYGDEKAFVQLPQPKPMASPEDKHMLFQSNAVEEFPTTTFGATKIPHIIHIVYKNVTIPFGFVPTLRGYFSNNPDWEFRFWSFETGRQMIAKTHPYLMDKFNMWNNTAENNKKKSDMIRHVAMYEYGGFTADLDVENLRSLDIATKKYDCIVPSEPFEHSVLLYTFDFIISKEVMLCRPNHPFFKHLINQMRYTHPGADAFDATGGGLMTRAFFSYNNMTMKSVRKRKTDESSNSPYCNRGNLTESDPNAVYVPNTQYFNDNLHPKLLDRWNNLKTCSLDALQGYLIKRACAEFASRRELRKERKYAFTFRHFSRIWEKHYTQRVIHIKKIIPRIIF